MKKVILGFIVMLCFASVDAQQQKPNFSFDSTLHDFGNIKEEAGNVAHTFSFTNTGGQPLVINNVRASCGCTTPEWTRTPIPPGGKGFIKATYNPQNRPGPFNKTITVTANTQNPNTVLRITGSVEAKPLTIEDEYPRELEEIRLKSTHISFTRIDPKGTKTEELEFINPSDHEVKIEFDRVPSHIKIKAEPAVVPAGGKGKIITTYDAAIKNDWGFVYDQIFVNINGNANYKNRISVNANIQEDFNSWTETMKKDAAKIAVDDKIFDFGEINEGESAEHTYIITNEGKSDLVIRKVKASCGCTAIEPEKTVIAPGEKTSIKAIFNSRGKSGRQNKSITVITNDPLASNILLRIQGTVNTPEKK